MLVSKRTFLLGSIAVALASPNSAKSQSQPSIHVLKGRGCACCTAWADLLEKQGFAVTSEELHPADLIQFKIKKIVPQDLVSCHTAEIDGYVIEGHVPGADVYRLISERPDAIGIGVAGMPYGSPGMGPEEEREQYDVVLFKKDNSTQVFSSYDAAS